MVEKNSRPNIIFIESDSMDGRIMGSMGHQAAPTPNMDKLASQGVLFKNTYCNSPQCVPSRASMWTGKFPHDIQAWNNRKGVSSEHARTFQKELDRAGYQTEVFGPIDYLSGSHTLSARVTAWTRAANIRLPQKPVPEAKILQNNEKEVHKRDWETARKCIDWIKKQVNDNTHKPFFSFFTTGLPHPEFRTSLKWFNKINRKKINIPPVDKNVHPAMDYMKATKNCLGTFADKEILDIRQTYYAMITELDGIIGYIIDSITDLGIRDNTYIIYISDHGEMNMEHSQWLKNSMYESSARVPFIVSGPGILSGNKIEELVSLIDIYPTLMDIANIDDYRKDLEGTSLMPQLKGKKSQRKAWIMSQYHSNMQNTGSFMLRKGKWKYIAYVGYKPQLFNLEKDPEEINDLSTEESEITKKMDEKLKTIIDYEKVDKEVKEYDRQKFLEWKNELGEEIYQEKISGLKGKYYNWGPEQDKKIKDWLNKF